MEKKYKIKYLPIFYKDLDQIIEYMSYKLTNKIVAERFVNELEQAINQRAYSLVSYEKFISNRKRKDTYFRIYVKNYTVFYTIKDEVMEVRRILSNRRNFDKLI